MKLLKRYKNKIIPIILLIILLVILLIYLFNDSINSVANIIIISFILSYVISPARDLIEYRFKIKKSTASLLLILGILSLIITCVVIIIPELVKEVSNIGVIFDNIAEFLDSISGKFKMINFPVLNSIYNEILEKGNTIFFNFSKSIIDNLILMTENIISCAILPVVVYYFLCDGEKIYNKILLILPTEKRALTKRILNDIDKVLGRYIASQIFLSVIIGFMTFVLLIILKVKFPVWISLLNAVLNIIPYFGPIFGGVPAVIVALLDSPIKAFWVACGIFIIQQIEGNILSPKITGDSTDMHPIVIIILLLIGDKFGGFIGMVLAVPIGVVIKVLYDDINYYLF